jgi:hypothetical protein
MRQKPYEYLNPRPRFRFSYWWQDTTGELWHEIRDAETQDTGHVHIHIPEEHARWLRGQVSIVKVSEEK